MKAADNQFTEADIKSFYDVLKNSEYEGIQGVHRIDSTKPNEGPNVGITIATHGNEIAGLASYIHYTRNDRLKSILKRGSVTFAINNLQALEQFFDANGEDEEKASMYIDHNMNRLPKEVLELVGDSRYEIRRALELYPVFEQFDAGIDIHSTYGPSTPMIVEMKEGVDYLDGSSISTVLTNMPSVQKGMPISSLYGGINTTDIPVIGVEAGAQGDPTAFGHAIEITNAFLQKLGMIPQAINQQKFDKEIYRVSRPILFPNDSYSYIEDFKTFDEIRQGQILATGSEGKIIANQDGHILFPKHFKFDTRQNEAGFISDLVKRTS